MVVLQFEEEGRHAGQAATTVVDMSRLLSGLGTAITGDPSVRAAVVAAQLICRTGPGPGWETQAMSVATTWFRNPYDGFAGTLNLCFNALDLQVVRGRASEPAVVGGERTLDYATLLEQVSALAGALSALGVSKGDAVVDHLDDPVDSVLLTLATSRLGGVLGSPPDGPTPKLLATSRDGDDGAQVRLLRGVDVVDETRDLAWELAVKAGREDPAACIELPGDAPAFVQGETVVEVRDGLESETPAGRIHAVLAGGGPLDVHTGSTS